VNSGQEHPLGYDVESELSRDFAPLVLSIFRRPCGAHGFRAKIKKKEANLHSFRVTVWSPQNPHTKMLMLRILFAKELRAFGVKVSCGGLGNWY
jgi:hypothetical protein